MSKMPSWTVSTPAKLTTLPVGRWRRTNDRAGLAVVGTGGGCKLSLVITLLSTSGRPRAGLYSHYMSKNYKKYLFSVDFKKPQVLTGVGNRASASRTRRTRVALLLCGEELAADGRE